jgi:hypothetical protein
MEAGADKSLGVSLAVSQMMPAGLHVFFDTAHGLTASYRSQTNLD